jgi:predicted nucleotidyltransferase
MSLIDQYLRRSQEIIGSRTESEERYDNEVIKWLKEGMTIGKAINRANERYPDEALKLDKTNVDDVAAHYEYLMQHLEILQKVSKVGRRRRRG